MASCQISRIFIDSGTPEVASILTTSYTRLAFFPAEAVVLAAPSFLM